MKTLNQQNAIYLNGQLVSKIYWDTKKEDQITVTIHGRMMNVKYSELHN